MKGFITGFVLIMVTLTANGQRSVDALFEKYEGTDDFVCITIDADLIKIAKALNCFDDMDDCLPSNISRIRILTQDKDDSHNTNFFKLVEKDLDRKNYEELVRIKESDQDLVLLARAEGRSYKELLLVGGGQDNLIIQLKGKMTYKEARKFAERMHRDRHVNIDLDWD
jgi:hypothetical protein